MTTDSLAILAVSTASKNDYINLDIGQRAPFAKTPPISNNGGLGGLGNCSPSGCGGQAEGFIFCAIILSFAGPLFAASAYDSCVEASAFEAKKIETRKKIRSTSQEAERKVLIVAEKIYDTMAIERRISSTGQGFLATAFFIGAAIAIGAICFYYHPASYSNLLLEIGLIAGAYFLVAGPLIYLAAQIYACSMRKELEEAATRIEQHIQAQSQNKVYIKT